MQDRETGSLWSHVTGECIYGELKGWKLDMVPAVQTTWAEWSTAHPDTLVLRKREKVLGSKYQDYKENPERLGIIRTNMQLREFPGKNMVYGLTVEDGEGSVKAAAVSDEVLLARPFVELSLADRFLLVYKSADGGVRAWEAMSGGKPIYFRRNSEGAIRDEETGSIWNLEIGKCIEGKLEGMSLPEIVVRPAFWFAWISFYPNSTILKSRP